MTTQFFNFGNNETFHFFTWICARTPPDLDALIDEAFQRAETLEDDEFEDEDICEIAKERLARRLHEILFEEVAPHLDPDVNPLEIGTIGFDSPVRPSADSLLLPIFAIALQQIDFGAVAEALLIRAGKWSPSKTLPEIR